MMFLLWTGDTSSLYLTSMNHDLNDSIDRIFGRFPARIASLCKGYAVRFFNFFLIQFQSLANTSKYNNLNQVMINVAV